MRILRSSCLFLALSACSERATPGAGGDAGGTIVVTAIGGEPSPLLPPLAADGVSRLVVDQVYDRLADISPTLNTYGDAGFTPRLAKSWAWSKDSLSVAFALDPAARWHDGAPVRANDVAFSFDVDKDPKTGTQVTPTIANVDSVTTRDSLTAVVWFHRRKPEQFYDFVYQVHIMPAHVLKGIAHDQLATSVAVRQPVGSGRFRFARSEPGVRIELLADTANYRGRPKLDRIVIAFAADPGAAVTSLLSGQADLFDATPAAVVPRIDSSKTVRAVRYPSLGYAYMAMNLRDPKRLSAPHPVFGDVRVRRAISMALDRQSMLKNVYDTLGVLGAGPFPRALADTTVVLLPFDRARAAALLDSAGWRVGADGVRAKNGRPLAFSLSVPTSSSFRMRYAVLIQEQLKAVGARVTIDAMDFGAFQPKDEAHGFDAIMNLWSPDPDRGGIKQTWGSEYIGKGGHNTVSYASKAFDALIDSSLTTFDKTRADRYAHRAYQTLVDDAPAVWLYDQLNIAGMQKRIHPTTMAANGWWTRLEEWSIPANERIDRDRIGVRQASP